MEHVRRMGLSRALLLATLALPAAALSYAQGTGAESGKSVVTDSATSPADKAVAEHVYSVLNADPNHYYRHVTIRAQNGVVTLGGFVWSQVAGQSETNHCRRSGCLES